jgi:hypothetical protein
MDRPRLIRWLRQPEHVFLLVWFLLGLSTLGLLLTWFFTGNKRFLTWGLYSGAVTIAVGFLPLVVFLIGLAIEKRRIWLLIVTAVVAGLLGIGV